MVIKNKLLRSPAFFLVFYILVCSRPAEAQQAVSAPDIASVANDGICERLKFYVTKATEFSKTAPFQLAMAEVKEHMQLDPSREYTITFGKDSLNAVTVSPIGKGNKSNGVVPVMPNGFADLHNHPKNTPPSSGDLYGLLLKNRLNTRYDMRYILTAAGAVYVLVVMDTTAARLFASKYPQQQVPGYSPLFPDALLNEYREIHYRYGVAEELVMPYILEKYATGVFLLKQSGDGDFAVLRTSVSGEGDNLAFGFLRCQ